MKCGECSLSEAAVQLIWTIVIGFVAGLVAKLLEPGSGPRGFLVTAMLGVTGALVASFAGQFAGLYSPEQSARFIGAVIGATALLLAHHFVAKK
jgi:uncharacterized membrane protein YeaQ/YmgE (transglycosylase-associated protein family)